MDAEGLDIQGALDGFPSEKTTQTLMLAGHVSSNCVQAVGVINALQLEVLWAPGLPQLSWVPSLPPGL